MNSTETKLVPPEEWKALRAELGWSQAKLAKAERAHVLTISRREREGAKPGSAYTLLEALVFMKRTGVLPHYLSTRPDIE